LRRVAGLHLAYSWPLLSAASDGRVELEALTQLQIAWKSASTGELLKPETAAIVLRSLWTITEAAAALPDCGELRTLAESATARAQPALAQTLAGLPQKLSQPDAVVAAAYASLVLGRDPAARARLLRVWAAIPPGDTPAAVARPLVDALLAESASIPHDRLTALAGSGVEGDDLVVLAAIACRRAGGRTWETFRARSAEWLGQQPLPGDVVVLISRLSGAPLPLVAVR
jgi:hypothetical protein